MHDVIYVNLYRTKSSLNPQRTGVTGPSSTTTVYYPLPEFQPKRLHRVLLVAASFFLNRYVNDINDIVKIGWLPVRE